MRISTDNFAPLQIGDEGEVESPAFIKRTLGMLAVVPPVATKSQAIGAEECPALCRDPKGCATPRLVPRNRCGKAPPAGVERQIVWPNDLGGE